METDEARSAAANDLNRDLTIGEVVGTFRIEAEIGRGGMGRVYLARHTILETPAALKMFCPKQTLELEHLERFQRSCQVAARLAHPNIVRVLDSGVHRDQPYLVTSYVDGFTIGDVIDQSGRMQVEEARHTILCVARALAYCHEQGVIHRDIKPRNVLSDADGHIALTDFDLVRAVEADETSPAITQAGHAIGTAHYMSPEQVRGAGIDGKSDVYALGSMWYELLSGDPPFGRGTPVELATRILREPPRSIEDLRPDIGPDEARLLMHTLAKESADRPTANELTGALESLERIEAEAAAAVAREDDGDAAPPLDEDDAASDLEDDPAERSDSRRARRPGRGSGRRSARSSGSLRRSGASGNTKSSGQLRRGSGSHRRPDRASASSSGSVRAGAGRAGSGSHARPSPAKPPSAKSSGQLRADRVRANALRAERAKSSGQLRPDGDSGRGAVSRPQRRGRRPNEAIPMLAGVGVLALGAFFVVVLLGGGDDGPSPDAASGPERPVDWRAVADAARGNDLLGGVGGGGADPSSPIGRTSGTPAVVGDSRPSDGGSSGDAPGAAGGGTVGSEPAAVAPDGFATFEEALPDAVEAGRWNELRRELSRLQGTPEAKASAKAALVALARPIREREEADAEELAIVVREALSARDPDAANAALAAVDARPRLAYGPLATERERLGIIAGDVAGFWTRIRANVRLPGATHKLPTVADGPIVKRFHAVEGDDAVFVVDGGGRGARMHQPLEDVLSKASPEWLEAAYRISPDGDALLAARRSATLTVILVKDWGVVRRRLQVAVRSGGVVAHLGPEVKARFGRDIDEVLLNTSRGD